METKDTVDKKDSITLFFNKFGGKITRFDGFSQNIKKVLDGVETSTDTFRPRCRFPPVFILGALVTSFFGLLGCAKNLKSAHFGVLMVLRKKLAISSVDCSQQLRTFMSDLVFYFCVVFDEICAKLQIYYRIYNFRK